MPLMNIKDAFKFLHDWTDLLGVSIAELSRKSGVSRPTVCRILNGTINEPSYENIRKVWNALEEIQREKLRAYLSISQMVNPQVSGVQLTNTVGDAIVHMINEDYSVIPVTDEHGVYIGKISRKLLARMFEDAQKISKLSIGQLIKKKGIENIKAVSINERLPELLEAIMEEELVLVKDGEKIIGIITWWDILYNLKNCFTRRNPAGEREI